MNECTAKDLLFSLAQRRVDLCSTSTAALSVHVDLEGAAWQSISALHCCCSPLTHPLLVLASSVASVSEFHPQLEPVLQYTKYIAHSAAAINAPPLQTSPTPPATRTASVVCRSLGMQDTDHIVALLLERR